MGRNLYTYVGAGKVYLRKIGAVTGLLPVGDASQLQLSIETNALTLPQHSQAGGGNLDKITRVTALKVALTLSELSPANVAMAVQGAAAAVQSAAVSDEVHAGIVKGALVEFLYQPDMAEVVSVVAGDDSALTPGVDYELTPLGLIPLTDAAVASGVKVGYQKIPVTAIELLSGISGMYELVFEGLNEANGGIAQPVKLYRVQFDPVASLDLITDDFGNIALTGEALVDSSKTGVGLSRYGKIWIPS